MQQFKQCRIIANTTQERPSVMWNKDFTILNYCGDQIEMSKLSHMMLDLSCRAEHILRTSILMSLDKEVVDSLLTSCNPSDFREDMSESGKNYSFLTDARSPSAQDSNLYLLDLFLQHNHAWGMFFHMKTSYKVGEEDPFIWLQPKIQEFFAGCEEFLQVMGPAVWISSGPPGRGTEASAAKIKNTSYKIRSLSIVDGDLTFIQQGDKTRSITGRDKLIARCVPPVIGRLLIFYLRFVRPLEKFWSITCGYNRAAYEIDFWVTRGVRWRSENFSEGLKQETFHYLGCELGISKWRQVSVSVTRHILKVDPNVRLGEENLIGDLIYGHGSEVARLNYAVSSTLQDESVLFQRFIDCCRRWQHFFGLVVYEDAVSPLQKMEQCLERVLSLAENTNSRLLQIEQQQIRLEERQTRLEDKFDKLMNFLASEK